MSMQISKQIHGARRRLRGFSAAMFVATVGLSLAMCGCGTTAVDTPVSQLTPDELCSRIDSAWKRNVGQARNLTPEIVEKYVQDVIPAADAILADPNVKTQQREFAELEKYRALQLGEQFDPAKYAAPLADFAKEATALRPDGEVAAAVAAEEFLRTHFKPQVAPNLAEEMDLFAAKFPHREATVDMFEIAVDRLTKANDSAHLKAVLAVAKASPDLPSDLAPKLMMKAAKFQVIGEPVVLAGQTLTGSPIDLADYRGKVVLVDFWATWCGPCVAELPHLKEAYAKYHGQGFEIIAVSLDSEEATLSTFIKQNAMPWPQIISPNKDERGWDAPLLVPFQVRSIPAMLLVGKDGRAIAWVGRGPGELEAAIESALAATPAP